MEPTAAAIGTWSGGRFMHFGEPLPDARMRALLRPGEGIDTVITADVYGEGDADRMLGAALEGCERHSYCLVGAIGHDFYTARRDGAKGFPRFTDPRLRAEAEYAAYIRMATEHSLERCRADFFDLLLLHNPDRRGYSSAAVWEGMEAVREAGLHKLERMRPLAERHGLTLLQLACAWNLAHAPVACVAPTLIQESGAGARPIEDQRAQLAAVASLDGLSDEEVAEIRRIGENTGCMALKGASAEHEGDPRPDRWPLDEHLLELAQRWDIDPERDLARRELSGAT